MDRVSDTKTTLVWPYKNYALMWLYQNYAPLQNAMLEYWILLITIECYVEINNITHYKQLLTYSINHYIVLVNPNLSKGDPKT